LRKEMRTRDDILREMERQKITTDADRLTWQRC
jgi:hypothetical protein